MPAIHYFNHDVGYLRQKHDCPVCSTRLKKVKVSRDVDMNSPEAANFPPNRSRIITKTTKYVWKELECPGCRRHFTVEQMKQIEATSKERLADLLASPHEPPKQAQANVWGAAPVPSTGKGNKKALLLVVCIIAVAAMMVLAVFTVVRIISSDFVDTNGAENFALTEITREDIVSSDNNVSAMMSSQTHSGYHTNIVGTRLRDCDYDHVSRSFGRLDGILIIQATNVSRNTLTLHINSTAEKGNAEIVILVDGEYYCSVDVNQAETVTLQGVANKDVLVKLAGEGAKIKVDVDRVY